MRISDFNSYLSGLLAAHRKYPVDAIRCQIWQEGNYELAGYFTFEQLKGWIK